MLLSSLPSVSLSSWHCTASSSTSVSLSSTLCVILLPQLQVAEERNFFSNEVSGLCCLLRLCIRSSVTSETSSSCSSILPSSSSLSLQVSVRKITSYRGCVSCFLICSFLCFLPIFFVSLFFSEPECSVERPSIMSSPVRSDLCTFVAFCADPDPHLFGLPDLHLPFGQTTALVYSLDTNYRVSPYKTCQST